MMIKYLCRCGDSTENKSGLCDSCSLCDDLEKKRFDEIEFLKESNAIEREYSKKALDDSIKAWDFAKKYNNDINLDNIKWVHYKLMRRLNPRIAGKLRTVNVRVGSQVCLSHQKVKAFLETICNYNHLTTEEIIQDWHVLFEKIHPFEDGNGRTGRIIMNVQRLNAGLPILVIHEGKEQLEYYAYKYK